MSVARKVELPENLQEVLDNPDNAIDAFRKREAEKAKKRIERSVKRFESKFSDPESKEHQVFIRKLLMQQLRSEIKEKREAIKGLMKEIRELRGNKRRNSSKKKAAATK